jgi:hypothetical protein
MSELASKLYGKTNPLDDDGPEAEVRADDKAIRAQMDLVHHAFISSNRKRPGATAEERKQMKQLLIHENMKPVHARLKQQLKQGTGGAMFAAAEHFASKSKGKK